MKNTKRCQDLVLTSDKPKNRVKIEQKVTVDGR